MFLYSTFYEYTSIMSSHDVFCSLVFCIFLNGFHVHNKEGYDYEVPSVTFHGIALNLFDIIGDELSK